MNQITVTNAAASSLPFLEVQTLQKVQLAATQSTSIAPHCKCIDIPANLKMFFFDNLGTIQVFYILLFSWINVFTEYEQTILNISHGVSLISLLQSVLVENEELVFQHDHLYACLMFKVFAKKRKNW